MEEVATPHPATSSGDSLSPEADEVLYRWAGQVASADCDSTCRLNLNAQKQGDWWEELDSAAERVCWGCDDPPWPHERQYGRRIWEVIHAEGLPIRAVASRCNLHTMPCHQGVEAWTRGSRCLVGHFVYAIMCFFRWMGEGQDSLAFLSLESAMDLAPVVLASACAGEWGFPVPEVAENYERFLTAVWHRHESTPEQWIRASGPLRCKRQTHEPQESPHVLAR